MRIHSGPTRSAASMIAVAAIFTTGPMTGVAKAIERPPPTRPAPRAHNRPPTSTLAPARTSREPRGAETAGG